MAVDFREHLRRQLRFLGRSCAAFDAGHQDEAVRIATSIRVLLHDTRSSTSLLTHLGAKQTRLRSVVPVRDVSHSVFADLLTTFTGSGPIPKLRLGAGDLSLVADEWWRQVVYVHGRGNFIARRDLVLGAANRDGGAHVDSSLTPEYEAVMGMWSRISPEPVTGPVTEIPLIGLRTLGFEVLSSPEVFALAGLPAPAESSSVSAT